MTELTIVALGLAIIGTANLLIAGVAAFALWRMVPILGLLSRTLLTMQLEYSEVRNRLEDLYRLLAGLPLDNMLFPRYRERGAAERGRDPADA